MLGGITVREYKVQVEVRSRQTIIVQARSEEEAEQIAEEGGGVDVLKEDIQDIGVLSVEWMED